MTAKEYLNQARLLDLEIKSYLKELENLNSLASGVKGIRYDVERVDGTKSCEAPFMKYLVKISALEVLIEAKLNHLLDLRNEISLVIANIDNTTYQIILRSRYLSCKTWQEIADELFYGVDNVYKLHREALKCIEIPNNTVKYSKIQSFPPSIK